VLGPILFLIFINELSSFVMSLILKFAGMGSDEDRQLLHKDLGRLVMWTDEDRQLLQKDLGRLVVRSDEDRQLLQKDLDRLVMWADERLMQFNEKKCKSLHIGKGTSGSNYKTNGHIIENTNQRRI